MKNTSATAVVELARGFRDRGFAFLRDARQYAMMTMKKSYSQSSRI